MCDTPSQLRSTRSNNNNSTSPSLTAMNSTTVSTFNCSILSLNCAKGKAATTLEALHFASTHSNYNIVLLQEPHLNSHKLPPPLNNFQLFYPPPSPKSRLNCATYVRKSANLQPSVTFTHSTSFLGVTIKTPEHPLTIYNFYSPGKSTAVAELLPSFTPNPHSLICGDFNAHHGLWYGDRAVEFRKKIADHSRDAEIIVDHATTHSLTLHNTPGELTFFHRSQNGSAIIDLTFSRGKVTNEITDWKLGDSFNSDHLS
jgi:hypothetical protein